MNSRRLGADYFAHSSENDFLYVGLAILGVVHWRASPGIALIVTIVVIRTVFLTQLQTCEPRYVLVCLPALLALGRNPDVIVGN